MDKIYCLFSIDNDYDQPSYNLVAWFSQKPSIEQISRTLGCTLTEDKIIVAIAKIWQGEEARIANTDYRIREVREKEILKEQI